MIGSLEVKTSSGRVEEWPIVYVECCTRWPVCPLFQVKKCGMCGQVPQ